jgi:hypothetical protein
MESTPKWIYNFLEWWAKKREFVLFFVALFGIVFVLLFGNYPQWEYQKKLKLLNSYFSNDIANIELSYFTETDNNYKLSFKYSDGAELGYERRRPNKHEIVQAYKTKLLNKVCLFEEFTDRLYWGQIIEVDVKDGDWPAGVSQLFNMRIMYDRCHT